MDNGVPFVVIVNGMMRMLESFVLSLDFPDMVQMNNFVYHWYLMNICTVGSLANHNWFRESSLLTFLNAVHCNGSEMNIFECQYNQNNRNCPTWSDASVICHGL